MTADTPEAVERLARDVAHEADAAVELATDLTLEEAAAMLMRYATLLRSMPARKDPGHG